MPKRSKSFEVFVALCAQLADRIASRRAPLLSALTTYESHHVAEDEFARSINCLRNARVEAPVRDLRPLRISTFFPLNLPLYSLVLFAVMPSFYCSELFVRPPLLMRKVLDDVVAALDLPSLFDAIRILAVERAEFLRTYAAHSDVVIFTGTYANAMRVRDALRHDALLLYNGAGVNPILVLPDADARFALSKVVEVKAFNSGQDCAGPDSVLVPAHIASAVIAALEQEIGSLRIGSYEDPSVRIGPLIDMSHLHFVGKELALHRAGIRTGGQIDFGRGIVHPTLIVRPVTEHPNYTEFFAPIFFVNTYDNMADVTEYFADTRYSEHAMYVSVFGDANVDGVVGNSIVLRNATILDVEQGNREFGGFGNRASFVAVGRRVESRPILISRDIQEFVQP